MEWQNISQDNYSVNEQKMCLPAMFMDSITTWMSLHTSSGSISCLTSELPSALFNLSASFITSFFSFSLASVSKSVSFSLVKLKIRLCAASNNCKYNTPDILLNKKHHHLINVYHQTAPKVCSLFQMTIKIRRHVHKHVLHLESTDICFLY